MVACTHQPVISSNSFDQDGCRTIGGYTLAAYGIWVLYPVAASLILPASWYKYIYIYVFTTTLSHVCISFSQGQEESSDVKQLC